MLQKHCTFSLTHAYIQHRPHLLTTRRRGFGTFVIVTLTVIATVAADGDDKNLCIKTGDGVPYPKEEYIITDVGRK
jgi:hypothetical protein